ncbi:hypothetical protein ACWCOW_35190 [Streptomyces sp. NPDC001939]
MHAQPEPTDRAEVHKLASAVEEVLAKEMQTRYLNPDLQSWEDGPRIGTTPAVRQPGAAPMSQQATDIGKTAMYCGLASVPPGLIAIGIIVASEHANPAVVGLICAAPAAISLAASSLFAKRQSSKTSLSNCSSSKPKDTTSSSTTASGLQRRWPVGGNRDGSWRQARAGLPACASRGALGTGPEAQ